MGFGDFLGSAEDRKKGKEVMLQRHLWCTDDSQGQGTEVRPEMTITPSDSILI